LSPSISADSNGFVVSIVNGSLALCSAAYRGSLSLCRHL